MQKICQENTCGEFNADETWRYPRFFTTEISGGTARLCGNDLKHAGGVLRMKEGSYAVVCDGACTDYLARYKGGGMMELLSDKPNTAELNVKVHLFMSALKGEKNEFVVQKAVELGAAAVTPVITSRCVAVPDMKSRPRKTERYRRIAYEAAKQCGRGIIPLVGEYTDFRSAVDCINNEKKGILFYECGGVKLTESVFEGAGEIAVFIGSEGGYSQDEAVYAVSKGFTAATLGNRILRADTAPVAALTLLAYLTNNM